MNSFIPIFIPIVNVLVTSASIDISCCSDIRCRCFMNSDNVLVADCSSSNLTIVPEFNSSVRIINLSNNDISILPASGRIPLEILKLNLSINYLSHLSNGTFKGMADLKELDLSYNQLYYNSFVFKGNIFDDMTRLEYLNIKFNCKFPENNGTYPRVIGKLENLRHLLIDGMENASFTEEFKNLRKLESLDLSGHSGRCHIVHLRSGMFKNVPTLWHLNLTNCNLRFIEIGTFRNLGSLRTLNLSDNTCLSFRIMENVTHDVQYTNLTVLSLKKIHCEGGLGTILFQNDIKHLMNSSVQEIYLDDNRLENFQAGVLSNLPKSLRFISAYKNRLLWGSYILESSHLVALEKLDISLQFSIDDIRTSILSECNDWRGPIAAVENPMDSKHQEYQVNFSKHCAPYVNHSIANLFKFYIPPRLKILYAWTSSFHSTIGKFHLQGNLTELHAQGNWFHFWEGPIYGLNDLEYLDLSFNMCANVSNVFFDEFRNLRVLNVSNNNLGFVFHNHVQSNGIFKNLDNLQYLDLSFNRIYSFSNSNFRNLTNIESLNFSHNLLIDWNIEISQMTKLKHLDISYNQIGALEKSLRKVIDSFVKSTDFTINMRGNILRCSCDDIDFLEWLYNRRRIFIDFTDYQCRLFNNSLLSASRLPVLLTDLHRDCSSYVGLIAGVMAAILLSSSIMICGLLYRYRWRLKYLYYVTKSKHKVRKRRDERGQKFELDAFVSYANEEHHFINTMIRNLETEYGCKLCIHGRDFVPGRDIAENITNAIQRSRRTIIVLTNNYPSSYWCMFEFNMARMESIYKRDGEDVMFMILYQHVRPRDLPLPLMDVIETNSYIEFPDDVHGQEVFWNTIKETITKH